MDILIALAASTHINSSFQYNAIHPHLRIQHNNFIAGVFGNSIENTSFYAGLNKQITQSLSIDYGLTTGYQFSLVSPMISINQALSDNVDLFVIPSVEQSNNQRKIIVVTGVQVKF